MHDIWTSKDIYLQQVFVRGSCINNSCSFLEGSQMAASRQHCDHGSILSNLTKGCGFTTLQIIIKLKSAHSII